eukprot:11444-Heterococcus_DN1.PRE.3
MPKLTVLSLSLLVASSSAFAPPAASFCSSTKALSAATFTGSTQPRALQARSALLQRRAARLTMAAAQAEATKGAMTADGHTIGVVGATGAVGEEIVSVLHRRGFPVKELKLFSSARSAGKVKSTPLGDITIKEFSVEEARTCDYVFLAVDGDFAKEYAMKITENDGPVVIDNSSAWRMDPDVPLVVPEINISVARGKKLIANPNCTTSIALMALYPLHKEFGIKRCIISTYQAASGAGAPGMQELLDETKKYVTTGEMPCNKIFAHPLPLNVIPHIDKFQDNMYTKEEMKVAWESRKIMDLPDLLISCTSVRIPTLRAHSESITIETNKAITADRAREVLRQSQGVRVVDDPLNNQYPMPLTATGSFDVEVGRIRANDVFGDKGLDLFVCGDQLLRGAALNAVIIAEAMSKLPVNA